MYRIGLIVTVVVLFFASCEKKETKPSTPEPDQVVDVDISSCVSAYTEETLEIATWNIKFFPQSSITRATLVDVLPKMNIDIIAVQEINNMSQFRQLADEIEGWSGVVENIFGEIELGFLYKDAAIASISAPKVLFPGDGNAFPREAVEIDIVHTNGLSVKLINIHLKCCSEGEDRRMDASTKLKAYLDDQGESENLVLLGDFNDDILDGSPFTNFIEDTDNYFFADQSIAEGTSSGWSYPNWPSHIDHILCTNDLADNLISTQTVTLDDCITNYNGIISDHLPVVAVFEN